MIYRSNLTAPDLAPQFKHAVSRPLPYSLGHDVLSDWSDRPDDDPIFGLYKQCAFLSPDEGAILYQSAKKVGGTWVDIGAHTGYTALHELAAGCWVFAVDSMFCVPSFEERFRENVGEGFYDSGRPFSGTSDEFFASLGRNARFSGVMIDGNHDAPCPLLDAQNALAHLKETGVIVFHDFWGRPIRQAVEFLMGAGLKCRIYDTPAGMAVCWRGDFTPVEHIPDPAIRWCTVREERAPEFDFGRTV